MFMRSEMLCPRRIGREGGGGRDEGGKEGRGRREEQRGDEGGHKQWGLKKTSKHNSSEIQLSKF
jgi:hypothetical protein